jgi:hypothetical protein
LTSHRWSISCAVPSVMPWGKQMSSAGKVELIHKAENGARAELAVFVRRATPFDGLLDAHGGDGRAPPGQRLVPSCPSSSPPRTPSLSTRRNGPQAAPWGVGDATTWGPSIASLTADPFVVGGLRAPGRARC